MTAMIGNGRITSALAMGATYLLMIDLVKIQVFYNQIKVAILTSFIHDSI